MLASEEYPGQVACAPRERSRWSPPHSRSGCGVAVDRGCGADVLPKHRGEVMVVRVADPGTDLVEEQRGLRQQVLRTLHPAQDHVLVRRLPGRLLEQVRKVRRAGLRHRGELDEG